MLAFTATLTLKKSRNETSVNTPFASNHFIPSFEMDTACLMLCGMDAFAFDTYKALQ